MPDRIPVTVPRAAREPLLATAALAVLALVYWKWRILDAHADPALSLKALDLYNAHLPMTGFGFAALARGHIPLWNPYQLMGEPFLATYQSGIFYPLHFVYLLFDVPLATEISLLLHMLLGGVGMWWLSRRLELGTTGALVASVTFMWSGNLVSSTLQPTMFSVECWMPITVCLLDRVLHGERRAWLWLVLAGACQLLIGRLEFFVHTLYACALFTGFRLLHLGRRDGWRRALGRAGVAGGCLAMAVLLAAVQLLPTRELAAVSPRSPGTLTIGKAIQHSRQWSPLEFVRATLDFEGAMAVGVLSVAALGLAIGDRRRVHAWGFALVTALLAGGIASGGTLFELYFATPLGKLFRTPIKFLDLFAFAEALLAGLAVARLEEWRTWSRARLWRSPSFLAAIGLTAAAAGWLAADAASAPLLLVLLALLVAYGAAPGRVSRRATIAAVCAVQAASLFLAIDYPVMRPVRRPDSYWTGKQALFQKLGARAGYSRIYISPRLWFIPGTSLKQGLRHRVYVSIDYDPLVDRRYQTFIRALSTVPENELFNGRYRLVRDSDWALMALTGTRYFVVRRTEPVALYMAAESSDPKGRFRLIGDGDIQVYQWADALPRALFVPHARILADPDAVLAALRDPSFDPRAEVLLEGPLPGLRVPTAGGREREGGEGGRVAIRSYRPEEVVLSVSASRAGVVVLSDLHAPGWEARVNGERVPILRADYLFRAVPVAAGESEIRFSYRPASFRRGLAVSVGAALAIALLLAAEARHRRRPG